MEVHVATERVRGWEGGKEGEGVGGRKRGIESGREEERRGWEGGGEERRKRKKGEGEERKGKEGRARGRRRVEEREEEGREGREAEKRASGSILEGGGKHTVAHSRTILSLVTLIFDYIIHCMAKLIFSTHS